MLRQYKKLADLIRLMQLFFYHSTHFVNNFDSYALIKFPPHWREKWLSYKSKRKNSIHNNNNNNLFLSKLLLHINTKAKLERLTIYKNVKHFVTPPDSPCKTRSHLGQTLFSAQRVRERERVSERDRKATHSQLDMSPSSPLARSQKTVKLYHNAINDAHARART